MAEVRGLVNVGEKEKVAEHLRVKLVTHDGTQYPTPWHSPVYDTREGLTLAPRRDNKEEMKGEEECSNFRKYATPPAKKRCIITEKSFLCSLGNFFGACFA